MIAGPSIALSASLVETPACAALLSALIDGRAFTARELARAGRMSVEAARAHLSNLERAGVLALRRQGPHRYFQLASEAAARHVVDALGDARPASARTITGPKDLAMRRARMCYGHLAGPRAVRIFDYLAEHGLVTSDGSDLPLTRRSGAFFSALGIDLPALHKARAPLCKPCLDWSERRSHLAGPLGTTIFNRISALGWATRDPDSRLVKFSQSGEAAFDALFVA